MDGLKNILDLQLTEAEVMIFLLVESGMSLRDLGKRLGVSHQTISTRYNAASDKMKFFADSGKFQTQL